MNTAITKAPIKEWVELMKPLIKEEGFTLTSLQSVRLVHGKERINRTPLMYEPSIMLLAQGCKTGYLGEREIHYNPGQYLVQTLPLPFECETHASSEEPLYGVQVKLDPAMLSELAMAVSNHRESSTKNSPRPMASVAMDKGMKDAVTRLLRSLQNPVELEAMGNARIRDVIFEALQGEQGPALEALVLNRGSYSKIVLVLSELHANLSGDFSVDELAQKVNMSVSTFHQHFKEVTHTSPIQYIKRLRLLKAQQLLAQHSFNVNQTSMEVGYRSVHHFSRDYKRYFGISPMGSRRQWHDATKVS